MYEICSFSSDRKFYAQQHFPYGIDRSGEFTCEQGQLLINHGHAYEALADGSREPATQEEERFLAVCRGEFEPETAHEKAWFLYCSKTRRAKSTYSSPIVGLNERPIDFAGNSTDFDL